MIWIFSFLILVRETLPKLFFFHRASECEHGPYGKHHAYFPSVSRQISGGCYSTVDCRMSGIHSLLNRANALGIRIRSLKSVSDDALSLLLRNRWPHWHSATLGICRIYVLVRMIVETLIVLSLGTLHSHNFLHFRFADLKRRLLSFSRSHIDRATCIGRLAFFGKTRAHGEFQIVFP